ncbi:DUF2802 domain-containing protein [Oceanospirillum sediminis]|uniref:DUF2802 domain-containing protein n=1 Tax=Oceanospirillum sediminis TaxID=2760088 RepID=A0A839IL47_9GAMM|nr:DUF2802 domain-containing protein [Oceanospirillum sediminis]MBB1485678.1 DUF2802 domain-containing protein [Oceanospirillum sediminis]
MQDLLIYILILVPVLLAIIALVSVSGSKKQINELRQQLVESKQETEALVQALRNETHAMGSGSIGIGQRLQEVEKKLNLTVEKQVELEQKDSGSLPYTYAIRLVEMGASSDDLVENCGLARVEADLISLVHSGSKRKGYSSGRQNAAHI